MTANQAAKTKNREIIEILTFTLPIILTNVSQNMFNIIDQIIVRSYSGDHAIAAIGATSSLSSLFVNLVIGVSVGASAVIARRIGSQDKVAVRNSIHTSMGLGFLGGLAACLICLLLGRPILMLMKTPKTILGEAVGYLSVLSVSYLPQAVYNFSAAALRARGDTKRPLYFLAVAGVVKTGLTFLIVAVMGADVAWIPLSTVVSFTVASILAIHALSKQHGEYHLRLLDIRLHGREVKDIMATGVPIGLMNSFMSLSNVVMQSAVNSFDEPGIAGIAGANHVNNTLYNVANSFSHSSTIYCSMRYGANDRKGFKRSLAICLAWMVFCSLMAGAVVFRFRRELLSLFVNGAEAIEYGVEWINIICFTYFLSGAQETFRGALSAMNRSFYPMLSQTIGYFGVRTIWTKTYFVSHQTITALYLSYPIAWIVTLVLNVICFFIFFRRHFGKKQEMARLS